MSLALPIQLILAAIAGFIGGVGVNLLADYAPARRLHFLAKASPFVSASAIPPLPHPLPRLPDGRVAPIYAWSGILARLSGRNGFAELHSRRRILVEIGTPLAFVGIVSMYADAPNLPFLLFYALALILYVVVDVEYRWILFSTIWPVAVAALVELALSPRLAPIAVLRGGLYTFGIMLLLYVLGIAFGQGLGAVRGRAVGRTVLGFGDVRLAVLGGVLVGWPNVGLALLIMVFSGALAALTFVFNKLVRTRRYRANSAIPYGPYIVIGIAVMLYAPWLMGDLLALLIGG